MRCPAPPNVQTERSNESAMLRDSDEGGGGKGEGVVALWKSVGAARVKIKHEGVGGVASEGV